MMNQLAYSRPSGTNILPSAWAQGFNTTDRIESVSMVNEKSICADELSHSRTYWHWISPSKTITKKYLIGCLIGRLLEKEIIVPNIQEVWDYLLKYDDMTGLVLAMCRRTKEVFFEGPNTQLVMELERDSEFGYEHLNLLVRLQSYNDGFWDKVEKISREFEYDIARKSGWILITTDYRRPQ